MSKLVGKYTADDLLKHDLPGSNPLIDKFLFERDNVLLVGKEKSNKSTFALQMCCHLSAGEPFLGEFDIPRAIDCAYIQAEGKLASTKQNLTNMTKVIPINKSKLMFLYYPSIPLNKSEGLRQILMDLDSWRKPELIVVDPLYQSMAGDISSQPDSTAMTANLRGMAEHFNCAILLIHHAHRPHKDKDGIIIDEGDEAIFGSFVWKAWPDSVFLIEKVRGSRVHRKYSCNTQRMGNVIESLELNLVEPSPFHLEIKEGQPIDSLVLANLNGNPFTIQDVVLKINKDRKYVSKALYRLIGKEKVRILDDKNKPYTFQLC